MSMSEMVMMKTCRRRVSGPLFFLLVAAVVLTAVPAAAQDNAGKLSAVSKRAAAARGLTVDKAAVSPEELAKTFGRKPEAQKVFFWVRDKISFEPYAGAQRGPRGTLMSRAGNAVDQALLLQTLLKAAGYEARLTRGKLDKKSAVNLLREFVGKAELKGKVPENAPTYDPSRDRALINTLQDHYWVEAKLQGDWIPMDPSFHRSPFGVHPAQSEGGFKALPDSEVVNMSIKVYVVEGDGSGGEVLSVTRPLPDLSWRNIVLRFEQTDRKGVFKNPAIDIGGKTSKGRKFRATGLNRVWVEYFVDRGGKAGDVVTRDIYVKDGAVDLFAADDQVFSIMLAPGWMNRNFLRAVTQREIPALHSAAVAMAKKPDVASGQVSKGLREYATDTMARAAGLVALTFCDVTDQITMKLAVSHGVRAWYTEPRIIMVAGVRKDDQIYWQIDLRNNGIKSVPAEGLPTVSSHAFQAVRGRFDSEFEGAVLSRLTGGSVTSTGTVFAAAARSKAGYATLYPGNIDKLLDGLGLTPEATDRLNDAVRQRGKAAVLPAAPVKVGGRPAIAWWELDLSGAIVGVREDGINGARFDPSVLTGKPGAGLPSGLVGEALFGNTLDLLDSLGGTVVALLGAVPNVCPVLCQCTADLARIPALTCQKVGAVGKVKAAEALQACLEPEKPSDDFLNLKLGCEGTVKPARCGALMSVATLRGLYSIKYSVLPVGNRTGPWAPEDLPPVDSARCNCR